LRNGERINNIPEPLWRNVSQRNVFFLENNFFILYFFVFLIQNYNTLGKNPRNDVWIINGLDPARTTDEFIILFSEITTF
jgi:hypothetical protein